MTETSGEEPGTLQTVRFRPSTPASGPGTAHEGSSAGENGRDRAPIMDDATVVRGRLLGPAWVDAGQADDDPDTQAPSTVLRHRPASRTMNVRRRDRDRMLPSFADGDELFGFRLRHPLGRGAFACVYLAEQCDLAGRAVVLKVSAAEGTEPQTLARLQHTNIVPIFSVHEDASAGIRAVCMPYFGGVTLAGLLEWLWDGNLRPLHGEQVAEAVESVGAPIDDRTHGTAITPLRLWRGMSYEKAVAWIIAQLADGLHHAHQRGVLHRDIKPSNILISAEGQPLLLDFNVAQEAASEEGEAILGGTVAYAAPEHLAALLHRTPEAIRAVDRRSDLYSLGLVLAEMITGDRLFEQGGSYSAQATQLETMAIERSKQAPSLRGIRRDVPWSLESITRKCLDPDPTRRYQQGDHLAEDLRRFLDDRPLRFAPELSRVDRARKFFRRHPRLLTAGPVFAGVTAALLLVVATLLTTRTHLAETGDRLAAAQALERKRAHDAGAVEALCLVNTVLGRQDHLGQGIAVCERTLDLYRTPGGQGLTAHPDWARLSPDDRRQLAEDRRELLLLLAGARVRRSPDDRRTLESALKLLNEAEATPGLLPSRALWLDRADYLRRLGDRAGSTEALHRAETIPAAGGRDHYLLAISIARHGDPAAYRRSVAELDQALAIQPRHYWSALQRGICRMQLGEMPQAVADFSVCIGLRPEHSWGYFNRGCVLDRMGLKDDAIRDYTAALARDPDFAAAMANRGLARVELRRYAEALEDFDHALTLVNGPDAAIVAGRGLALEGLGRHEEADKVFALALDRVPLSDPSRNRLAWTYGFAVAGRRPDRARAAFDEILTREPGHPQALYGRAMLAMSGDDPQVALRYFDQALATSPGFAEARRYRAVVLARLGQWDRATRDINACLEREPGSGPTLYAAACVAARAAAANRAPRAIDQALELLGRAWDRGEGLQADRDPDLAVLRTDPRFARRMAELRAGTGQTAAP